VHNLPSDRAYCSVTTFTRVKKCRIDLGIGLFRSKIHHARPDAISLLLHNLLLVQIQFVVFERCKHFGSKSVICG
jgi:hypothetical protein